MSDKLETKMDEIASAVVASKEAQDVEMKSVKEAQEAQSKTIEKLQDELAEVKAGAVNMPQTEKNVNTEIAEAKSALFKAAALGVNEKGLPVDTLISEKGIAVAGADNVSDAIQQELASQILIPAQEDYSIVKDMGVETVSSTNYERVVQVNRSKATWGSENTSNTAPGQNGTPSFVKISAKFAKLTVDNFITNEAAKDPKYDMESFLINDTRLEAGRTMAQGFIDGDGTGENPKGLLAHFDVVESEKDDATRSKEYFGEIEHTGALSAATDAQLIETLKELELSVLTPYLSKSKFYVNRATFKRLSMMKDNEGRHYLQPDLSGKAKGFLFGYPVVVEAFLQDGETVGNRPVIFGDLNLGFKRINYTGMSLLRNPYIVPGNVNFHWEMRVGTIIGDSQAVKAIRIA